MEDRLAEGAVVELPRPGQMAEQSACERVACPRGVTDLFERVRRRTKQSIAGDEKRAVLGTFDDHGARTEPQYLACRLQHAMRAAKLPSFGFVDGDDVDARHHGSKRVTPPFDPVIHRVERGGPWRAHLIEHAALDLGKDVGEENKLAVDKPRRRSEERRVGKEWRWLG